MARADTARDVGPSETSMLGIYLNDHLAGATAGTELAHRMARSPGDGQDGGTLRRLAAEIAQDRAALLDIMAALGIKVRRRGLAHPADPGGDGHAPWPGAWTSSSPGPGGRQMSSRTSGWPPPAK
jgi:hypothetical protein